MSKHGGVHYGYPFGRMMRKRPEWLPAAPVLAALALEGKRWHK